MESSLYRVLKIVLRQGPTDGVEEKIDIFYAAGKLTGEEYGDLIASLYPERAWDTEIPGEA